MKPTFTLERLKQLLHYDPLTGHFTWLVRRNQNSAPGKRAGVVGANGYTYVCLDQRKYLAHRLALFYANGEWPAKLLDHKHGDKGAALSRLRPADKSQNGANRGKPSNNTSGFKGAFYDKKAQVWFSQIQYRKRLHYLGRYESAEDAHEAYSLVAEMLQGEFARHV